MIMGAVTDNVGIVLYSYAMAMNSISTDPLLALYPIFAMIGGRILLKEKVSRLQYMYLIGIVAGSVMVVVATMR
jgi:drug/metabolite transporter (DMT)-like permease